MFRIRLLLILLNIFGPVTSWAVIDGGGVPKPAWYALRDAYRPQLLTVQPRGSALVLFAVNDSTEAWSAEGTVRRLRFDGTVLAETDVSFVVPPLSIASTEMATDVCLPQDPTREVLVVDCGGQRTWWWYAPDHQLSLMQPELAVTWKREDDRVVATITTDVLVRDLTIYPDRLVAGASIDRQMVSLLPGEHCSLVIAGAGDTDLGG